MRRIIKSVSLFCVLAFLLSSAASMSFAKFYYDVSSSTEKEIRDAVNYVSDHEIMVGTSPNYFDLDSAATRAQVVFVLYNYSRDTGTYSNNFTDVPSGAYYYNAVGWAQSKGITSGTTATTFSPNANVTREAFVKFLYNYAIAYGHPTSYSVNYLDYYTDKDDISSWAVNSVKWALARGILPFDSSHIFAPQSGTERKNCALGVHKYTRKLDRGVLGRDNYGFTNSGTYFTHYNYYVNTADQNRILTFIQSRYAGDTQRIDDLNDSFDEFLNEDMWRGSCYGMTTTAMLDKIGILGVSGYFSSNKFIGNITSLSDSLESMINVYQFSQSLPEFDCTNIEVSNCSESIIQNELDDIDKDMFTLGITYFRYGTECRHSLLITNWWKESGYYVFSGIDPNYTNRPFRVKFSNNYHSAEYGHFENGQYKKDYDVVQVRFRAGEYIEKYRWLFDYDGILNNTFSGSLIIDGTAFPVPNSGVNLQDLNRIEFNDDGDYTLTNDEGKHISFKNGITSGDMKIYCEGYVEDTGRYIVYVDDSASYTLEKDSDELYFRIGGNGYQMVYKGTGDKVTFYKGQEVKVYNCDNTEFTLKYLGNNQSIAITGTSAPEIVSSIKYGQLEICGLENTGKVVKREISTYKTLDEANIINGEKIKVF